MTQDKRFANVWHKRSLFELLVAIALTALWDDLIERGHAPPSRAHFAAEQAQWVGFFIGRDVQRRDRA